MLTETRIQRKISRIRDHRERVEQSRACWTGEIGKHRVVIYNNNPSAKGGAYDKQSKQPGPTAT